MARCITMAGLGKENDIIQVDYGYGLFTGGLGAHYGAEEMGPRLSPCPRNTKKLVTMMVDFGVTGIMCAVLPSSYLGNH